MITEYSVHQIHYLWQYDEYKRHLRIRLLRGFVSDKYSAINDRQLLSCAMTTIEDNDTPVQPQPCKAGSRNGGGSVRTTVGVRVPWSKYAACRLMDSSLPGCRGQIWKISYRNVLLAEGIYCYSAGSYIGGRQIWKREVLKEEKYM